MILPPPHLPRVAFTVGQDDIARYGDLTRDLNPIHLDPEFAATTPFGRPIAHGTMLLNPIWRALSGALGRDGLAGLELEVRFQRPVYPGEACVVRGVRASEAPLVYDIELSKPDGTIAVRATARRAAGPEGGADAGT